MVLERTTTEVSGWLSANGEWMLYANPDFKAYNPYTPEESRRCISLVNDTGQPRGRFTRLNRKHVRARGHVVVYDALEVGSDAHSRFMEQKTYKGEKVFNFCLRDLVFVATSIEAAAEPTR
ncbi:MAG TPA: hypothetical protein VGB62_05625 [Allosphingosinicella sp.]